MINLPVRVELQVGTSHGPACSLTIPDIPFQFRPSVGDFVILTKDANEPFSVAVRGMLHYDNASTLVITHTIHCANYDEMLQTLDWLKARYPIEDFQAAAPPEPYYVLFRTVVHLLQITDDVPIVNYNLRDVKVLAETCRTILIANLCKNRDREPLRSDVLNDIASTNDDIINLHAIVFNFRSRFPEGPELRQVLKGWDASVNINRKLDWDVDDDACKFIGGIVFAKLKCDKPRFLEATS